MIRRAMGDETLATCRNLDEEGSASFRRGRRRDEHAWRKRVPVTALQMVSTVGATDAEHTDVVHSESACYG